MPATSDTTKGNAGPTFELYAPFQLSTQLNARFVILFERLQAATDEAKALSGIAKRMEFISENISLTVDNLRIARTNEEHL